jgi:FixJ family two-component response regulator
MPEGPLIAVVDDDMSIRNATQDLLKAAGFSTATFSNATSFLDSQMRETVACLVTDMRMPGMSGLELHEYLDASGASIPTVVITAHPGEVQQERLRRSGIACFLIKPYAPDELLECVRKAVARSRARRTIPKC